MMSDRLKITFTGGDEIGDEVTREFADRLLIGRSHSADIRVREPDVSGRHLELVRRNGEVVAHNLSRFPAVVDGRSLATDEEAVLHVQSSIELGRHVRLRIDSLPQEGGTSAHEDDGGAAALRSPGDFATEATAFGEAATFATRVVEIGERSSVSVGSGTSGRVEESATRDIEALFSESRQPSVKDVPFASTAQSAPDGESAADDADTEDDVVPIGSEPLLHGLSGASSRQDTETVAMEEPLAASATETGDDRTGDGETQEMVTRVGSFEEILERRHQLDRAAAVRHWRFGLCIALCLAALGGVWFASANRKHLSDASGPFLPSGEKDIVELDVAGDDGRPEIFVEYPRDDRMQVVKSEKGDELEVTSFLGRDRDVPFRIWFKKERRPAELVLSLEESFARWMDALTKDAGFSFERTRNGNPLLLEFFDSVFDGYCEWQTQCGVPFMRADYTRTVGHTIWRGICYRLRCGDVAYATCCEIPDSFWKRGESRLRNSPFFGLYGSFIDRQWDSPGAAELVVGLSNDELTGLVRKELSVDRPGNWPTVEKWIDTLLVRTWGKNASAVKTVLERRDALLAKKTRFYNERQLAYETAQINNDVKRMRSVFRDCLQVFGASRRDRRYYLINDPNVWRCQWSR